MPPGFYAREVHRLDTQMENCASSLLLALLYVGRLCHTVYLSRSWIVVGSQLFWSLLAWLRD